MDRPYSYEFSPLAEQDLNDIFDYISLELFSQQAAEQLIDVIQTAVEKVCDFPFSRPLLRNKVLREKGYRLLVVRNFNPAYDEAVTHFQSVYVITLPYSHKTHLSIASTQPSQSGQPQM